MFLNDHSNVALLVETISQFSYMNKPRPRFMDLVNMYMESYI